MEKPAHLQAAIFDFQSNSHLWVVNPTNVSALFGHMKSRLFPSRTECSAIEQPALFQASGLAMTVAQQHMDLNPTRT